MNKNELSTNDAINSQGTFSHREQTKKINMIILIKIIYKVNSQLTRELKEILNGFFFSLLKS